MWVYSATILNMAGSSSRLRPDFGNGILCATCCSYQGSICNLLRPPIKILFSLVPYGYIIIKIKRIPKEMTGMGREDFASSRPLRCV